MHESRPREVKGKEKGGNTTQDTARIRECARAGQRASVLSREARKEKVQLTAKKRTLERGRWGHGGREPGPQPEPRALETEASPCAAGKEVRTPGPTRGGRLVRAAERSVCREN